METTGVPPNFVFLENSHSAREGTPLGPGNTLSRGYTGAGRAVFLLAGACRVSAALPIARVPLRRMAGIAADGAGTLVLAGPSGVGKGTLINKLKAEYGEVFGFSVSHTTRDPRPGEVDKVHYNFVKKELMEKEIEDGLFLESANVSSSSAPTESRSARFFVACQLAGMCGGLGASSQLAA